MLLTGKNQKNKGFLFLELMISISILSIGVLFILNSFITPMRAMEFSKDYFKAGLLIEQKMFEFYNSDFAQGVSKGVFSDFGNKFSWEIVVNEKEMDLKILWKEKNKDADLTIATYL